MNNMIIIPNNMILHSNHVTSECVIFLVGFFPLYWI